MSVERGGSEAFREAIRELLGSPEQKKPKNRKFLKSAGIAIGAIGLATPAAYGLYQIPPVHESIDNFRNSFNDDQLAIENNHTPQTSPTDELRVEDKSKRLENRAENALLKHIKNRINPTYLPDGATDMLFVEDHSTNGKYAAAWETEYGQAGVRLITSPDRREIIESYTGFPHSIEGGLSAEIASKITSEYYSLEPKSEFDCEPIGNGRYNYCESFWDEGKAKRGIGLQETRPSTADTNPILVFSCEFTKESEKYSWQSCAPEFSETGIPNSDP